MATVVETWRSAFFDTVKEHEAAANLKNSALDERLGDWTMHLTKAVVSACDRLGWSASAKAHKLQLLPIQRSEYLSLDVMAFAGGEKRWRFPTAIMELENQLRDDQIAYSLWKVICVRAGLRIVFCYRRSGSEAAKLVGFLRDEVIAAMGIQGRLNLAGHTLVVVGCRDEAEVFPYGYFKWWELDKNTGEFDRLM